MVSYAVVVVPDIEKSSLRARDNDDDECLDDSA